MAEFEEADQEWLKKVLEPYKSTVDQAAKDNMEYFASKTCPGCGSPMYPVKDVSHSRTDGLISTKFLLHCTYCRTVIEPDTGIIVKSGEAYEPLPTIADLFIEESDQ